MIPTHATRTVTSLLIAGFLITVGFLQAQTRFNEAAAERDLRHEGPEWLMMAPHLPNLTTGSPQALEQAGDVLRARRMPDDALDYYEAALRRGAEEGRERNRIGITMLELHAVAQARAEFKRAVQLRPKEAEGWNNLGASEYVGGSFSAAVDDYKRAVKLNKKAAVFHSNLGTAYFDLKDYESAQKQFLQAVKLDPQVFARSGFGGVEAHVLSSADRGRFCFELAKISARAQDEAGMLDWLGKASEAGFDIRYEMSLDVALAPYLKDARVTLLVRNAKAMRAGQVAATGNVPALPAAK